MPIYSSAIPSISSTVSPGPYGVNIPSVAANASGFIDPAICI